MENKSIGSVAGIGGVFLYSKDPANLADWYRSHLNIQWDHVEGGNSYWTCFEYIDMATGKDTFTGWSIIEKKDRPQYEGNVFRINYRVTDLKAMVAHIRSLGTEITETSRGEEGSYARLTDPDGNLVELWEDPQLK